MSDTFPVKILPPKVRLTLQDCETLFGSVKADELYRLGRKSLYDTGLKVTLTGPGDVVSNIPFYLPFAESYSEAAVTATLAKRLGINAPVLSYPQKGETPGITVSTSNNRINFEKGVYILQRKLHLKPKKTSDPHMRCGDIIFIAPSMTTQSTQTQTMGSNNRLMIFGDVIVNYDSENPKGFYIDEDEAAASGLTTESQVRILGKPETPERRTGKYINKKKRLITENDVRQAIRAKEKIKIESWMMLTPAAKDLGKEHGVLIFA